MRLHRRSHELPAILVHLQLGQPHTALLHLSARLGKRFDARLVGVAVGAQPVPLPASGNPLQPGTIALDHTCDLVVAGAYGHSRLREWAFGGVTRTLVTQQQIAVMLSH